MKSHKNNTKDFSELSYIEQGKSISAQILNLEKAIMYHVNESEKENKNKEDVKKGIIEQINRMIERIK